MAIFKFNGDISSVDFHKIFVIDVEIEVFAALSKSFGEIFNHKVNRTTQPRVARNGLTQS